MVAGHAAFSHPGHAWRKDGGSAPPPNQDAFFVLRIDDHNVAYGVFDGHGHDNGTLIAQTASASVEAFLRAHFDDLRGPSEQKEALFVAAFRQAHEKCRRAIIDARPELIVAEEGPLKGVPVEEWSEADGQLMRESPDGGTTATVIALVDGCSLVHAQCGDSNAMLGGEVAAEGTPRAAQPRSPATRRRPATPRLSGCERPVADLRRDRVQRVDQGAQRDEPR
jgi:serine/threonine protein phosphatase PrpC